MFVSRSHGFLCDLACQRFRICRLGIGVKHEIETRDYSDFVSFFTAKKV